MEPNTKHNSVKESFKNPLRENLSLAVYNSGYEKCTSHHTWGPGTRDHYLIHFICSGKGTLHLVSESHELGEGDVFLITPAQAVSYVASGRDPWEYYWVGFNGTEAQRMLSLAGITKSNPIFHINELEPVKKLIYNIQKSSGNSPEADAEMIGHLYLFLAEIIKINGETKVSYQTRDYLAQALKYIQYNYANNIGISDIAYYVGISRSQLYRTFISFYDISPSEYLQEYRINRSCSLLRDGKFTITEIANSVGYCDPLYFSRVFKKIKGVNPSTYQKQTIALRDHTTGCS